MDQTWIAIVGIGGLIIAGMIALGVIKGVMSRGIDKVVDAGMRTVEKTTIAGLEEAIAVPYVLKSPASVAEIMEALDEVVFSQKAKPGFTLVVYESARAADRIEYSLGNQIYPQQLVVEVRFSERDGMTQVVFKCLHVTERNGMHIGAGTLMALRESVAYAVAAAGDPVKIAEGKRLYGVPEPGSPRAMRMRNKKYLTWAAIPLVLIPLFSIKQGWGDAAPLFGAMLLGGFACVFVAWRMDLRPGMDRAKEFPVPGADGAVRVTGGVAGASAAPSAMPEGAAAAVTAVRGVAGGVRGWWTGLSSQNKMIAGGALLAVLVVGGLTASRVQDWQNQAAGLRSDAEAEALAAAHEQVEADADSGYSQDSEDPATTDGSDTAPGTTPNGQFHWMQATDVTYYGPADGSTVTADLTFLGEDTADEFLAFSIDDKYLGKDNPDAIWDVQITYDEAAAYYIDDRKVSVEEFTKFQSDDPGEYGQIEFTKDAITKITVYTPGDI